jgi:signal transduction histidine kinase
MKTLHKLLKRQIAKFLSADQERELRDFLETVSMAYEDMDRDRAMIERSMELSSQELTEANRELRLRSGEIEVLYKILTITNQVESLEYASSAILEEVALFTKFPIVTIDFYDEEKRTLRRIGQDVEVPVERSPSGAVIMQNGSIYESDDLGAFRDQPGFWTEKQVRTFISLPISVNGKIIGVLSLAHTEAGKGSSRLNSWLGVIVAHIGAAVERERLNATMKVQECNMIAASRMSELGKMAGGIAHEINTPLATIELLSDQISDSLSEPSPDHEAIQQSVSRIAKTSQRIAKIISGLRTFSRDGSSDPFVSTNVKELVEETLGFCREKFKLSQVELRVDVGADLYISCRPNQISQVLLNLLNNSYDAIEDLEEKWISISLLERGDQVIILVTDSGKGISQEVRERIFNPFFTTKAIGKGTGLGLSISSGIVTSHSGSLEYVEKSPNTCFSISLPKCA